MTRSNYKPLGNYIKEVNNRDIKMEVDLLLGVSIQKKFIPSIANIIGTDMSTYKIIKRNQFAFGPVTSRNGDKISIALLDDCNEAIVSQAYTSFEVKDIAELLPEYLMMWFRRPEFDRYARFKSHGSAREIFDWTEMCNTLLPIPSITKQREIVKEYNVVVNRIKLNQQLIQKLDETAQAIYKQWFVDFEFPDEDGLPYKSNGGEMEESELGEIIPKGWEMSNLEDLSICFDYQRKPLSEIERKEIRGIYPYYGAMSIVDYINEYIYDGIYLLFSEDGANIIDEKGHPAMQYIWGKFWVNNHSHVIKGKEEFTTEYLYVSLKNVNVSHLVTGAAQPKINQQNMNSIRLIKPDINSLEKFNRLIIPLFNHLRVITEMNVQLSLLNDILLSKLATIEN